MKFRRSIAIFSIVVGIAMLAIWIIQLLTGQARELETAPIEIALAITADWLTAGMLLASGIGLLLNRNWAAKLSLFSLGMLVYSVLISSGYFGQLGNLSFIIMFGAIFILSVFFIAINIFENKLTGD
ncbi:MAG: hypothetical protein PHU23_16275 [Dehalococcoidales bacterium]|nr:hypothetical protein [Dehalococcoidales bacterium]